MSEARELYRDVYLRVTLERDGRMIRAVRSSQPFPDPDTLLSSYKTLMERIRPHVKPGTLLLQDQRMAVGRNDANFEVALRQVRELFLPMFERRATLVQSSVGKLQVSRLLKEDKLERLVSQDEDELLRYLGVEA